MAVLDDLTTQVLTELSDAARALEPFGLFLAKSASLRSGDRVYLLGFGDEVVCTVEQHWRWCPLYETQKYVLAKPDGHDQCVSLHRSLFRKFTPLDHLADV